MEPFNEDIFTIADLLQLIEDLSLCSSAEYFNNGYNA